MKRWRITLLSIVLALAVGFVGCNSGGDDDDYEWTIKNQSSYKVTFEPNGQSWIGFTMNPGDVRYVISDPEDDGYIYYTYGPSNRVRHEQTGPAEITFLNK